MHRLSIIGMGTKGSSQLTLEGLTRLRECKKIFSFYEGDLKIFFSAHNIKHFESISDLYTDGGIDTENYQRIFDKIVTSIPVYSDVSIVVQGHPRVGVTFAQWFSQKKSDLSFEIEVIPGISSFAAMINDLELDPLERGSVLLDANRALLFDFDLSPFLNYFIYHICSVGTKNTHFTNPARENRLDLLKKYLLKYFPKEHKVTLIKSATSLTSTCSKIKFPLTDLENWIDKITFASTLYVPACQVVKINNDFLNLLRTT